MTWFQLLTIPLMVALTARSSLHLLRGTGPRLQSAMSCMLWAAAALAVAWPDITTSVAQFLGIGRGADLLLYLSIVVFAFFAFHIFGRLVHLQSRITSLVRYLAIEDARARSRGTSTDDDATVDKHVSRE